MKLDAGLISVHYITGTQQERRKGEDVLMVVLQHFYSGAIFGALVGIIIAVMATFNSMGENDGLKEWALMLAEFVVVLVVSMALAVGSAWSILNIIFS